jgi:hypothetical protein
MSESEFIEKRNQLNVSAFWQSKLAVFSPVAIVYLTQLWSRHEQEQAANIEKSKLSNNLSALAHRKAELFKERRAERAKFFQLPFTPALDGERAVVSKAVQAIQGQIAAVKKAERAGRKGTVTELAPPKVLNYKTLDVNALQLQLVAMRSRIWKKRKHIQALEAQEATLQQIAVAKNKLQQLESIKLQITNALKNKKNGS